MEKRIYYHDTDAGGVVYYANYLKYMEEARTQYLLDRGIALDMFLYAVRECNLRYRSPARYGDIIKCSSEIKKISAAQIFFQQNIINKADGKLLVEAEVTLVCLTRDFKPAVIPDEVRGRLLTKL
ncbi:MAG: YbgC/FadM family acyl-CoA thioesterase [Candidatus Omnitrophica bacterium]|nr:YbgC/FadM family acyl-CoA thioesterase [Candidatus Omnitrophota bacterium]